MPRACSCCWLAASYSIRAATSAAASSCIAGLRPWRPIAVGGRLPRFERRPCALESTLDRGLARVAHLRDLGRTEAEDVAQHERRALAGRQMLEGDDERKLARVGCSRRGQSPSGWLAL
jgi:hypothetical protein